MKKFIATIALALFTVVLTSYNNTGDDIIAGDENATEMKEPGNGPSGSGTILVVLKPSKSSNSTNSDKSFKNDN